MDFIRYIKLFNACTQLVLGTPHFQSLVNHLVQKDQLEHIVITALKAKRYNLCIFAVGWALYRIYIGYLKHFNWLKCTIKTRINLLAKKL